MARGWWIGLLEPRAVIPLASALADKSSTAGANSEHTPILLEQTEVGGIIAFVIA